MNVVSLQTGRSVEQDHARKRVLLVTKHPFVPLHDGTSAIIALWFDCLRSLDLDVEVLSFDYVAERWSEAGRAHLARSRTRLHVVAAYGSNRPALRRLACVAYAALRGHRFAPERLRTDRIARGTLDAVFARPYDLIVVHGVDAVQLAGPSRLASHPAPTLLDVHDHVPYRIVALQRALLRLLCWRGLGARQHVSRSGLLQVVSWPDATRLTRAECRVASVCDRVLCSAENELDALRAGGLEPDRLIPIRWPMLALVPDERPTAPDTCRYDFGFIGSGALFNVEGLIFFLRRIWPLIRAMRPTATLLVAGRAGEACARLPVRMRAGVSIAGWLDDLDAFYRAVGVVVVPLLSGTGVSVKTMEAAARGAAIVSTEAGLRGLTLRDGVEVRRADDPAAFASACVTLREDPALASRLGSNAREAMRARHDPALFTRLIEDLVSPMLATAALERQGRRR